MTEDEEAEGSSTSCSSKSHLKLSFSHMEVENKAKLSPMPPQKNTSYHLCRELTIMEKKLQEHCKILRN
jgi:hypothetical protein